MPLLQQEAYYDAFPAVSSTPDTRPRPFMVLLDIASLKRCSGFPDEMFEELWDLVQGWIDLHIYFRTFNNAKQFSRLLQCQTKIQVTRNISLQKSWIIEGGDYGLVIDGGGHTLTCPDGSFMDGDKQTHCIQCGGAGTFFTLQNMILNLQYNSPAGRKFCMIYCEDGTVKLTNVVC